MKPKEAIRLIRNLPTMCDFTDAYGEPIDSGDYYDAVDAAISALSSVSKEKQIQENKTQLLIDELSKMPPLVIETAYLHAINYTLYGEDVTEKWVMATQNASVLEKAYRKGYYDALQRKVESEEGE